MFIDYQDVLKSSSSAFRVWAISSSIKNLYIYGGECEGDMYLFGFIIPNIARKNQDSYINFGASHADGSIPLQISINDDSVGTIILPVRLTDK